MEQITLPQPDDWHMHLRDGPMLTDTVRAAAHQFGRVIVMPNLVPPVDSIELALNYRGRIMTAVPAEYAGFDPLMTLYLTDQVTPDVIAQMANEPKIVAVKWYPRGATTNSAFGITDWQSFIPTFDSMAAASIPLLIHGEVVEADIDIFDREQVFIERVLTPLLAKVPTLKIVLEHITTAQAVEFIQNGPDTVAATITAHHLLLNRNDLLVGGIKPHHYCLPILKRQSHQAALIKAATSGSKKFFLGTDSAPHSQASKESACGCAGIYTAPFAMQYYLTAFEQAGALDKIADFSSRFGAQFYGLPVNEGKVTYIKKTTTIPTSLSSGTDTLIPLGAGNSIDWQLQE